MRLHRFYVLQPLGEEVVIDDVSQVSQWTKVFRYTEGDLVVLFNGDGNEYCYSLQTISKQSCTLIRTKTSLSYIPSKNITLYLSLIKKDNFELVAQKVTELGITSIVPILSGRSEKKNLSFERLEKILIEASEQCGRGDVPKINPIVDLETALDELPSSAFSILLNMEGLPLNASLDKFRGKDVALFIGPEGGWSEEDMVLFQGKNIASYSLGKTVLRAETAAIASCVLVSL